MNPNETAVVDLASPPGEGNPVLRSLRSFGSRPLGLDLLEGLEVGGEGFDLGLARSAGYVTLFDLRRPERRDTTVFLNARSSGEPVTAQGVAVAVDGGAAAGEERPHLFLRSDRVAGVFSLALMRADPEEREPDRNGFVPVVNEISLPAAASDFAVFEGEGGARLLAVCPAGRSSAAAVVDPWTTLTWTVSLEAPAGAVRILRFPGPAGPRQVALLWNPSDPFETRIAFLELEGVEERLHRNLETVNLAAGVSRVIPTADPARLLLVDPTGGAVSLLDAADRTVEPLGVSLPAAGFALHPDGDALLFPADRSATLGRFVLSTRHPENVRLDAEVRGLLVLPGRVDERGIRRGAALLVDHGAPLGHVTALPLDEPSRGAAGALAGFLADGLLDTDPGRYEGTEVTP